jgi:hypothetical protein
MHAKNQGHRGRGEGTDARLVSRTDGIGKL